MAIIGAESVVYEATLFGKKVAVKKPILSTSDDIDKFHKELQLLWSLSLSLSLCEFMYLLNMFLCMSVAIVAFALYPIRTSQIRIGAWHNYLYSLV